MDLEAFIADSLREIVSGLRRAQAEVAGEAHSGQREDQRRAGAINPAVNRAPADAVRLISANGEPVYEVAFDIAVKVEEKAGVSTGIKVLGMGVGGDTHSTASAASRLQFKIPIEWPR